MTCTRLYTVVSLIVGMAMVQGCASLPASVTAPTAAEIASALEPVEGIPVESLDMLAVTPQMQSFLQRISPRGGTPHHRVSMLLQALGHPGGVRIEYDARANLTASQVFNDQRANCISFAALFIALVREAGFKARFQEVDVPPHWTNTDNDILIRSQHINTLVNLPGRRNFVGEFRRDLFDMSMPRRVVSDDYALALLYNNIGAQHLFDDDPLTARAYFVHALTIDPRVAIAWVNLGVAQRRGGRPDLAEIAYRQALALDPGKGVALNNLASVFEAEGRHEDAQTLRARALAERERNPHYHFALAQRAYQSEQFDAARTHLDDALRRDHREARFHHLLALVLWQQGEYDEAGLRLRRAERNAKSEKDKREYRDLLAAWNSSRSEQF